MTTTAVLSDEAAYDAAKAADTGSRTSLDDLLAEFSLTHADLAAAPPCDC